MWVSKNAEDRKNDFMEAASRLFLEKGYDKTSVNDIITAVGVTKGSFYHHYQSKEDVVNAIITTLSESLVQAMRAVFDMQLPAIDKLAAIIQTVVQFRSERKSQYACLYSILSREENHTLARRFQQAVDKEAGPMLADVIRQGNNEHVFHAPDANRTAGLLLKLSALYKAEMARAAQGLDSNAAAPAPIKEEAAFWQDTFERMLGARPGTVPVAHAITQTMKNDIGGGQNDHP